MSTMMFSRTRGRGAICGWTVELASRACRRSAQRDRGRSADRCHGQPALHPDDPGALVGSAGSAVHRCPDCDVGRTSATTHRGRRLGPHLGKFSARRTGRRVPGVQQGGHRALGHVRRARTVGSTPTFAGLGFADHLGDRRGRPMATPRLHAGDVSSHGRQGSTLPVAAGRGEVGVNATPPAAGRRAAMSAVEANPPVAPIEAVERATWRVAGTAVVGGVGLALAFPPIGLWPLAALGPALLVLSEACCSRPAPNSHRPHPLHCHTGHTRHLVDGHGDRGRGDGVRDRTARADIDRRHPQLHRPQPGRHSTRPGDPRAGRRLGAHRDHQAGW